LKGKNKKTINSTELGFKKERKKGELLKNKNAPKGVYDCLRAKI
jgi:hypothetical protein